MKVKGKQGFASMDPDKRRLIASSGGKASQATGKAHRWNREEASVAGKKGRKAEHPAQAGVFDKGWDRLKSVKADTDEGTSTLGESDTDSKESV